MSTSILKALPGKLDVKRHSPNILFLLVSRMQKMQLSEMYKLYETFW